MPFSWKYSSKQKRTGYEAKQGNYLSTSPFKIKRKACWQPSSCLQTERKCQAPTKQEEIQPEKVHRDHLNSFRTANLFWCDWQIREQAVLWWVFHLLVSDFVGKTVSVESPSQTKQVTWKHTKYSHVLITPTVCLSLPHLVMVSHLCHLVAIHGHTFPQGMTESFSKVSCLLCAKACHLFCLCD